MNLLARAYRSSLGKKYIMAITGLLLFLFVIVHMLGNLQVYIGKDAMNAYAALLKSKPALLLTARAGLFIVAVLHILSALQLAAESAEPGYRLRHGEPVARAGELCSESAREARRRALRPPRRAHLAHGPGDHRHR